MGVTVPPQGELADGSMDNAEAAQAWSAGLVKVLARDDEGGSLRLRVDSLDDLWHLRELVERGDVAIAQTWRTADIQVVERAGKVEKRPVTLGVRVENVEWDAYSNRVRLLGPIVEGAQDVGSYHTISIEPGMDVTIRKPRGWRAHQEDRLKEAIAATSRPLVTILSIEENEAVIALLRQYGVQKMAEIVGHVSGKRHAPTKGEEEAFFDEILLGLRDYRPEGGPLLIVGPGFAKERFLAYARAKQAALVAGAGVEGTGQAGMTGVHEALKRGSVDRVAKDQRVAQEAQLVERFLEAVATDAPVAYGLDHVRHALDVGAVDVLLVADHRVREGPGETLLDLARRTGAEAHVVSTHHEAGKRFDALTGYGALLRYPLSR